jgi:hypothetical protein
LANPEIISNGNNRVCSRENWPRSHGTHLIGTGMQIGWRILTSKADAVGGLQRGIKGGTVSRVFQGDAPSEQSSDCYIGEVERWVSVGCASLPCNHVSVREAGLKENYPGALLEAQNVGLGFSSISRFCGLLPNLVGYAGVPDES